MANVCMTDFKVTGSRKAVNDLWNTLQKLEVNSKKLWLDELAKFYGIDYQKKGISVRGGIICAEYEERVEDDFYLLSFSTETAWSSCTELFEEINHLLGDELSISLREIEPGCEIFFVHDEGNWFPHECCVSCSGEPFEEAFEELYESTEDAIKEWCSKMGVEQGSRTNAEMLDYISEYEYEDDDTYFYINEFVFD